MIETTQQLPGPKEPALIQQIQYTFDPFGYLERCVKQYGDIFVSCLLGNVPIVIVSKPEHLQELFNPKTKVLDAPGSANQLFEPQLGKIL
jgi:cytochrome P450